MQTHRHYRSVFWPIVLLGVGAIWLLSNLGYINTIDLGFLVRLWPVLLIIIGLDLLFGRIAPWASAIFGLLVVGALIFVLVNAPSLGLAQPATLNTQHLVEPIGSAESATVELNLSMEPATVSASTSGDNLLVADLREYGSASLQSTGETAKVVRLVKSGSNLTDDKGITFTWPGFSWDNDQYWKIALTDRIPLEISLDAGLGSADVDLTGLKLSGLVVNASLGSFDLVLPISSEAYDVYLEGSAGSMYVTLPENTTLTVHLDGSAGSTTFTLPSNHALHVEVLDGGLGSVNLPSDLVRVSSDGDTQEGVWENQGFSAATYRITIIIEHVGPGSITIR